MLYFAKTNMVFIRMFVIHFKFKTRMKMIFFTIKLFLLLIARQTESNTIDSTFHVLYQYIDVFELVLLLMQPMIYSTRVYIDKCVMEKWDWPWTFGRYGHECDFLWDALGLVWKTPWWYWWCMPWLLKQDGHRSMYM